MGRDRAGRARGRAAGGRGVPGTAGCAAPCRAYRRRGPAARRDAASGRDGGRDDARPRDERRRVHDERHPPHLRRSRRLRRFGSRRARPGRESRAVRRRTDLRVHAPRRGALPGWNRRHGRRGEALDRARHSPGDAVVRGRSVRFGGGVRSVRRQEDAAPRRARRARAPGPRDPSHRTGRDVPSGPRSRAAPDHLSERRRALRDVVGPVRRRPISRPRGGLGARPDPHPRAERRLLSRAGGLPRRSDLGSSARRSWARASSSRAATST